MSVQLRDVRKTYVAPDGSALTVLDVPEFELSAGEQLAMVGTSGSGKTTLLHCIAGLLKPDAGRIVLTAGDEGAIDLASLGEAQRDVIRGRHIGYVFQTHHLLSGFTALENVLLGMSFTGRRADPQWARHLLNEVGLSDRLHYKPGKLSVGQQQRVAVARALANRPRLVLADEPTGALDSRTGEEILKLFKQLQSQGHTIVLISHDPEVAARADRVLSMHDGELKELPR